MFWAEIWKILEFLSENFQFLVVIFFSIYLNRRVFVMRSMPSVSACMTIGYHCEPSQNTGKTASICKMICVFVRYIGRRVLFLYCNENSAYRIYPEHTNTLIPYHTCHTNFNRPNIIPLNWSENCWVCDSQFRLISHPVVWHLIWIYTVCLDLSVRIWYCTCEKKAKVKRAPLF